MVKHTYIKKVVSLIQQTDASDLVRQSVRTRVRCIWRIWRSVAQAPVVHAELWSGQLIWVSGFQQRIQAWLNSNGLFMVSWYECSNTLMHPFVRHHWRCLTAQKPDSLVFYLIVAPSLGRCTQLFFSSPQSTTNALVFHLYSHLPCAGPGSML